jgi:hypothetical protein
VAILTTIREKIDPRTKSLPLITAAALLIGMLLVSDLCCVCSKYHTLNIDKGVARFSFEYPSSYEIDKIEVLDDTQHKITSTVLSGPRNSLLKKYEGPTTVFVSAHPASDEVPNVKAAVDRDISLLRNYPDYQLVDRFPVIVGGAEGEEAVHSFTVPDYLPNRGANYPKVNRIVHFENSGTLFRVDMLSSPLNAEADKNDFDYLLNTFKISPDH